MGPHGSSRWDASYTLGSHDTAPDAFKEPCMLGIDEAGRGPVLGPMVYGIAFCPVSKLKELKDVGFADSKQLDESERDTLFDRVKEENAWLGYAVTSLMPQDISRWMLGRVNYNLNAMSHDTAISLVDDALTRGVNVQEVYVDTVGDPGRYQAKLKERFPTIGKIVVAKKADSLYPIVSAASICAKVTRDHVLRTWVFGERLKDDASRAFGSGYPSDPATTAWLADNIDRVFGFPQLIRFSWSTCSTLLGKRAAQVEWFERQMLHSTEATTAGTTAITSYFKKRPADQLDDDEPVEEKIVKPAGSLTQILKLRRVHQF